MRVTILLALFFLPAAILAQITAPGMNAVRYTSYPANPAKKDPVFIYCNYSGEARGTLHAVSPGGTGPFNFTWYKWNDATVSYSTLIKSETGLLNSTISDLDEGGYRVIINSATYNTSLDAWVFLDRPGVQASLLNRTCDYVALTGKVAVDTFYYSDPSNGARLRLPDGVRFLWSSEPESSIPYPDFDLTPQTFIPPLEDVTYMLEVTDSFTCSNESSFFYESIHVRADFSVDPPGGEAPLEVTFTDKSVRALNYRWEFGDDTISEQADPGTHTYYKPGEYSIKLTIESDLHCIDSLRFNKIFVEPSDLEIPNVFTPDGDGYNDSFVVERISLKYINVKIYSRSGLKVYSFDGEGERLKEWEGWDGYVNSTSAKASPGVYFYLIRAVGWDDIVYNGKEYRGFVYLYR